MSNLLINESIKASLTTPGCAQSHPGKADQALSPSLELRRYLGFSIVELLVVIAIAGVLAGVVFSALRAVKGTAAATVEKHAAKQLMVAYFAYAAENKDFVLPGYADRIPNDPGNAYARPVIAWDRAGRRIEGGGSPPLDIARQRYLWRLAPYLKYNIRGLFANDQEEVLDKLEQLDHHAYLYQASVSPLLGLNSQWIGGDSTKDGFLPPAHTFRSILDFDKYYLTALSQAQYPDRLMVFGSARGVDPVTNSGVVEGYFRITSPYYHELQGYQWSEEFAAGDPPERYGFLSPRHRSQCVTAFIDGHVDVLSALQVKDMRYWANWATTPDWRLPKLDP